MDEDQRQTVIGNLQDACDLETKITICNMIEGVEGEFTSKLEGMSDDELLELCCDEEMDVTDYLDDDLFISD